MTTLYWVVEELCNDDEVVLRKDFDALAAAARKVTCDLCAEGPVGLHPIIERGNVIGYEPCPDCAELRALLEEVK